MELSRRTPKGLGRGLFGIKPIDESAMDDTLEPLES